MRKAKQAAPTRARKRYVAWGAETTEEEEAWLHKPNLQWEQYRVASREKIVRACQSREREEACEVETWDGAGAYARMKAAAMMQPLLQAAEACQTGSKLRSCATVATLLENSAVLLTLVSKSR